MARPHVTALPVYATFALQSTGQAISWQFVTYFVSHELQVESFVEMAAIWSGPAFVTMFAAALWGVLSDRVGARKPFMILGFAVYAETFFLYSFVSTGIQYFVLAMVGAMFSAAALPAGQAYLTRGTTKKGERLGWFLVAQSAGWSVGAFASGVLYDLIGMFALYRISAVLCLSAMLGTVILVKETPVRPTMNGNRVKMSHLLQRSGTKTLLLAVGLSSLGNNAVSYVLAIIIADELGGLTAYVGYANAAATLLAVAFAGFVGRLADAKGAAKILAGAYACYILYATAFAMATSPVVATVLYGLPIYPLASTGAFAFAAVLSRDEERGAAMGLVSGVMNAGAAVGPIVGGLFSEYVFFRAQPVSWLNVVCNVIALLLAMSLLSLHSRLRADRSEAMREAVSADSTAIAEH